MHPRRRLHVQLRVRPRRAVLRVRLVVGLGPPRPGRAIVDDAWHVVRHVPVPLAKPERAARVAWGWLGPHMVNAHPTWRRAR